MSEDVDIEDVLADQAFLKRTLTEHGVINNEVLLKTLLKWKHNQQE